MINKLLIFPLVRLLARIAGVKIDTNVLDKPALRLINLFSIVEIITLVVWLILALKHPLLAQIGAIVILAYGLQVEHVLAGIAGKE